MMRTIISSVYINSVYPRLNVDFGLFLEAVERAFLPLDSLQPLFQGDRGLWVRAVVLGQSRRLVGVVGPHRSHCKGDL